LLGGFELRISKRSQNRNREPPHLCGVQNRNLPIAALMTFSLIDSDQTRKRKRLFISGTVPGMSLQNTNKERKKTSCHNAHISMPIRKNAGCCEKWKIEAEAVVPPKIVSTCTK